MFGAISQQSIQEKPVQQFRRRNVRAGPRRPPNNSSISCTFGNECIKQFERRCFAWFADQRQNEVTYWKILSTANIIKRRYQTNARVWSTGAMTPTGKTWGTQEEKVVQCHRFHHKSHKLAKRPSTYALKVQLFLSLIKHDAMRVYGGVEIMYTHF